MCRELTDSAIAFYLVISSLVSALTVTLFQVLLKSNCKTVACGCIRCERETTHNIRELEMRPVEVVVGV